MIRAENPTRYAANGMNPVRIPLVFLFIAFHLLQKIIPKGHENQIKGIIFAWVCALFHKEGGAHEEGR